MPATDRALGGGAVGRNGGNGENGENGDAGGQHQRAVAISVCKRRFAASLARHTSRRPRTRRIGRVGPVGRLGRAWFDTRTGGCGKVSLQTPVCGIAGAYANLRQKRKRKMDRYGRVRTSTDGYGPAAANRSSRRGRNEETRYSETGDIHTGGGMHSAADVFAGLGADR